MQKSKLQFKIKKFVSRGESETLKFARDFVKDLRGGEVIALVGELGAGKTVFTKGLARGLGIKERVQSPTFLLMKIYNVKTESSRKAGEKATLSRGLRIKHLCHVDAYRLSGANELIDIGILDWLDRADTVTVIEWADKVPEILRGEKIIKIKMMLGKKEEERIVEVISK